MAEEQQILSGFPDPPPFWKHFTKENVAKVKQMRKEAAAAGGDDASRDDPNHGIDILSLPTELRYLFPPRPPTNDKFRAFGYELDLNAADPTLADGEIEQLTPSDPSVRLNPQSHLIALARSLLTTFLALTGILSQDASQYEEKVKDLRTMVYNMHDLINQYRPHQARETLILMMEERIEKLKGETKAVQEGKEKVRVLLQELQDAAGRKKDGEDVMEVDGEKEGVEKTRSMDDARREMQRAAWAALEEDAAGKNRP